MGKKKNTPLKIVLPKEVEDERIKLAERLNLATHAAQMGIWDWDIQRNELVWDDRMYTLYGLKPGEFGGAYEAWLNGVHPDDRVSSNNASQQAVRGEKEYDTEFRVLWPDGSIHWLKANGQVFRDEKGNPLRMVGVNYDITKHKQAVKQIEKQNGRLSTLRKIDQAILSADSLENIVSVALDHIRELVDCRRANLTLIDRKTNELVIFEVSTVGETSIPAGRRLPLAQFEDIIQTLSKNQPIVFSDYRTIENPRPGIQSLLQDGILSTCSLPLFVQGSLIGMFSMHSEIPNFFNEEEIALGSEAANQVAIAIVQIRLTDALAKNEERLRLSLHASRQGLYDLNIQTGETIINREYAELLGYDPESFIETNAAWMDRLHPDDRAITTKAYTDYINGLLPEYRVEFRQKTKQGDWKWILSLGSIVEYDAEGKPLRMMGTHTDITERKRAEEQLRESEEFLRLAYESVDLGVWKNDLQTGSVEFDERARIHYGFDTLHTTIVEVTNRVHPDDVTRLGAEIAAATAPTGNGKFSTEYRVIHPDGSIHWLAIGVRVTFEGEGEQRRSVMGYGTSLDITERKRMESNTRESEQKYTMLFQKSTVPTILIKLPEVVVFDANEAYETLTGFTRQEMFGKTSVELGLFKPEQRKELVARFDREGGLQSREGRLYSRNGTEHIVIMNTTPVEIGGKTFAITTMQDITERRQAEEALREREQKLNTVLNLLPVGVSILDQNRNVTYANDALGKILETTQEGLFRGAYRNRKYLRTDGSERPAEEFASARVFTEKSEVHDVITGIVKEDAQTVWTSVSAVPVDFPDWKVVLVTSDITKRKQMEDALRQSEEKYAALFRKAGVPAALTKMPEGVFADVNDTFQTVFGYRREEIIGKTSIEIGMAYPKERVQTLMEIEQYGQLIGNEKHLFTKTGELRIGAINVSKVKINAQDYVITTIHDVTEQKLAEQALQQRTEELEQLLELLPSAVWIAEDPECKVIRGNRYANELLGVSKAENVSQSSESSAVRLRQFSNGRELAPDELPMQVAARTGQPQVDFELRIERPDQTTRVLIGGAVPLFDLSKKTRGAVAAFFDITDLKTTEDELRRSNAELEQFAYIASHDLQEPLRTLAGMVQLLRKRYQGQLDDRADEYIAHAVESADRMQSLIKDLLAYSRVDRRNQPIEAVSAQDCLQISLKNLDASIRESRATVMAEDLPIVHADATQLTQLFQNLIGNSIKFRGEREPRIQVTATRQNDAWQFAVSDNGIGIEAQYFERIFLVFQRLHTRRQYQGTGIGLALCKKIVERHGGSIRVESRPGEGSTFYFTLPIRSTP